MDKNKTCCFFGHREVTHNIRIKLTAIIENLITENGVTEFYVGHQGQFDGMVYSVLKELKAKYPHTAAKIPTRIRTTNLTVLLTRSPFLSSESSDGFSESSGLSGVCIFFLAEQ